MILKKLIAALLACALALAASGWAQQQPPQPPTEDEQVQPRFIWGILLNFALSKLGSLVWNAFSGWLENRLTGGLGNTTSYAIGNLTSRSGNIQQRSSLAPASRGPDVVVGDPQTPLQIKDGQENFQGVHMAMLVVQPDGKTVAFRPVSAGFVTGERFKLRVVSTFDGELAIENINPRGERRQIYPQRAADIVAMPAGKEVIVPLGRDDYFQFTGATGREQLVINVADPRAVGPQMSSNRVNRQDVKYGSNFVQEVTPITYPFISQAVELQHSAQ